MPNIDLSILNQRQTPAFFADTLANRPAAGFLGRIFVSTDTFAFYRDNGTGWDLIGGPGTGTITGTGASGQIALWNGASTITGDTGLTYDGTANSLTADKFIVSGGTSSQFLKGDGSLDSSTYLTTNIYNGNGTLSGERTISLNGNNLIFDGGSSIARVRMDADTNVARIFSFATNNLPRFAIRIDGTESGSDAGSDFAIRRYNDAGTFVDAPFSINRATGQSTFAKKVVIENNTGDQQLQIVSSTAPSLRIDNLQTGATRRIGIGLATTTNNFIQGTTGGEMAIFNSSTTASPILFGIYDAGLGNTQEAARISAARNLLVGKTTDNGAKLQVAGTSNFGDSITIQDGKFVNLYNAANTRFGFLYTSVDGTELSSHNGSGEPLLLKAPVGYVATFTNGTERLRVDINGNMGLGTINPTPISTFTTFEIRGATGGGIKLGRTGNPQFNLHMDGTDAYLNNTQAGNIYFYTSDAERGRWTTSGNLLLGTGADAGQKLQVNGTADITGVITGTAINLLSLGSSSAVLGIGDTTTGNTGMFINTQTFTHRFVKFSFQGNPMGEIFYNGVNTTYAVSGSDIRLKKNVEEWKENVLELFKDINPKLYNWNFQKDTDTKCKGFIAQEMTNKFPEAFHKGQDDMYLYNPSGMVVYLIKAIQELQSKIENLK